MNTELDHYFQGKDVSTKTNLGIEIATRIVDIEICRNTNIPFANSINELEIQDYRFLSIFFEKERWWKKKNNQNPITS